MNSCSAILGLWAETALHPGAGSSVGGIDLPIQREGHTGWPCIYGSAVKGALRNKAEDAKLNDSDIVTVFGPESGGMGEHAGALLVQEAQLLLLPVRSLTSHFKWVTCPAILNRLSRHAQRLNWTANCLLKQSPTPGQALLPEGDKLDHLFLEEYRFDCLDVDMSAVVQTLATISGIAAEELERQLVVVHNDQFNFLSQYATPVAAHIAIDSETKTVRKGALWYEETLPPETVLYLCLTAERGRNRQHELTSKQVMDIVCQQLLTQNPYLRLGGNETVGMGWCKVTVTECGEV
ncbi:MAG: type III-B CRISPR module RAMP protein Cmr4 [Gammaproteobacteria bacterium]